MNAREGNDMVKVTDIGNTGATILELHALAHIQNIGYCTQEGLLAVFKIEVIIGVSRRSLNI